MRNYFGGKTTSVSKLMRFPFNNFESYKKAARDDLIQLSIPEDTSRQWVALGEFSKFSAAVVTFLGLGLFIPAISALIYAFISQNYWYLLLCPLLLILSISTFSPLAARSGAGILLFFYFIVLIILNFLLPDGVNIITWLPVLIGLVLIRMNYSYAHSITLKQALVNEELVCTLWKAGEMQIRDNAGNIYHQRFSIIDREREDYTDVDSEWKKHIRSSDAMTATSGSSNDELEDWDSIKNRERS